MQHEIRHWHEDRQTQSRYTNPPGGVDHGAAGTILAEVRRGNQIAYRLVWFKGHKTPACGVRGFGHVYRPAHLSIIDRGGYWQATILKDGRISTPRLNEHAAEIDKLLGEGVTALIDPKRTLVVVTPEATGKEE